MASESKTFFDGNALHKRFNEQFKTQLEDAGAHEDHHEARLELVSHYSMYTAKIIAVTCICFNLNIEKFIKMQADMTRQVYLQTLNELEAMEKKQ